MGIGSWCKIIRATKGYYSSMPNTPRGKSYFSWQWISYKHNFDAELAFPVDEILTSTS